MLLCLARTTNAVVHNVNTALNALYSVFLLLSDQHQGETQLSSSYSFFFWEQNNESYQRGTRRLFW